MSPIGLYSLYTSFYYNSCNISHKASPVSKHHFSRPPKKRRPSDTGSGVLMTTVWHVFESGYAVGDLWIPLCSPEHRKRRFAQAAWPEGVSKTKMFLSSFFISDVYCSGNGFSFFGHAAWSWIREEKRWCKSLRVSPPFSRSAFLRHRSLPKARAKAEAQGRRDPVEVIWLLKIRVSLSIIFYWVQLWANGTTHLVMFIFSNQFFWSQSFWIIAICILWWVGRTTLSVELGGSSCMYGILTLRSIFCCYVIFTFVQQENLVRKKLDVDRVRVIDWEPSFRKCLDGVRESQYLNFRWPSLHGFPDAGPVGPVGRGSFLHSSCDITRLTCCHSTWRFRLARISGRKFGDFQSFAQLQGRIWFQFSYSRCLQWWLASSRRTAEAWSFTDSWGDNGIHAWGKCERWISGGADGAAQFNAHHAGYRCLGFLWNKNLHVVSDVLAIL